MPDFIVTGPDGQKYSITGPPGATQQDAEKKAAEYFGAGRQPSPSPANPSAGAPAMERMAASFSSDPLSYWQEKYPGAYKSDRGDIVITDPQTGEKKTVNRAGLDAGDVAELAGSVPGIAASLGGAAVGGAVGGPLGAIAGSGLGSAAGNVVKQGIGALLPGEENTSLVDRALETGVEFLIGSLGEAAGQGLVKAITAANPWNFAAKLRTEAREAAGESAKVGEEIRQAGIPLTAAQAYSRPGDFTYKAEDIARQHFITGGDMRSADEEVVRRSVDKLGAWMERISPNGGYSAEGFGQVTKKAFDDALSNLVKKRDRESAVDFAAADLQGHKVSVDNTLKAIDDMVAKFDMEYGAADSQIVVNRLKKLKESFMIEKKIPRVMPSGASGTNQYWTSKPMRVVEAGPIPLNSLHLNLGKWGEYAAGKGLPFQDLDSRQQRSIAAAVFGGLKSDLDAAADSAIESGMTEGGVAALRRARDKFRENSTAITQLRESTFGEMFKTGNVTPEDIAGKVLKMAPSELRFTTDFLAEHKPEFLQDLQRYFIENALKNAIPSATNRISGIPVEQYLAKPAAERAGQPLMFSAAQFIRNMPTPDQTKALFGGATDKNKAWHKDMMLAATALERLASSPPAGSQTAGREFLMGAIRAAANPMQWPKEILAMITVRRLAKESTSPAAMEKAFKQSVPGNWVKPTTSAITQTAIGNE